MNVYEAKDFFETYLAAWNAQDLEAAATLFVLPDKSPLCPIGRQLWGS